MVLLEIEFEEFLQLNSEEIYIGIQDFYFYFYF
jgi:hypothetical protein